MLLNSAAPPGPSSGSRLLHQIGMARVGAYDAPQTLPNASKWYRMPSLSCNVIGNGSPGRISARATFANSKMACSSADTVAGTRASVVPCPHSGQWLGCLRLRPSQSGHKTPVAVDSSSSSGVSSRYHAGVVRPWLVATLNPCLMPASRAIVSHSVLLGLSFDGQTRLQGLIDAFFSAVPYSHCHLRS
jgi:hypothetical protein